MAPLKAFALPGFPAPAPVKINAPKPVLKQGAANDVAQVRLLQATCNFWGWRDAYGKVLLVDGDFGAKTAQAVISMQRALKVGADGVYGTTAATALQRFLDGMAQLKVS
jgi:peptidoglycan hydrolase-like protein with peptidoglycan-binding domain